MTGCGVERIQHGDQQLITRILDIRERLKVPRDQRRLMDENGDIETFEELDKRETAEVVWLTKVVSWLSDDLGRAECDIELFQEIKSEGFGVEVEREINERAAVLAEEMSEAKRVAVGALPAEEVTISSIEVSIDRGDTFLKYPIAPVTLVPGDSMEISVKLDVPAM